MRKRILQEINKGSMDLVSELMTTVFVMQLLANPVDT